MPIFAATFWDKSVRIFEVTQTPNGPGIFQKMATSLATPALSCCWNGDNLLCIWVVWMVL